jgi:predicted metal-dependent enzyme (double-stranded beta helix superfamily)
MSYQNYFISESGQCKTWTARAETSSIHRPYRLYRFLTDLENLLEQEVTERLRLKIICDLVRRLLKDASWLYFPLQPDPATGWAVNTLYDEPDFALTLQLVAWSPGIVSPIHNHAAWGAVALLNGQESHTLWRRSTQTSNLHEIEQVNTVILAPGDIITFSPNAIHQVEPLGDEIAVSFNVYGETEYSQRFEFDAVNHRAVNF